MIKVAPPPRVLLTRMVPPMLLMTPKRTDMPSPVPLPTGLVVKKGLKTFSMFLGLMPVPLAVTLISTQPTPEDRTPMRTSPPALFGDDGIDGVVEEGTEDLLELFDVCTDAGGRLRDFLADRYAAYGRLPLHETEHLRDEGAECSDFPIDHNHMCQRSIGDPPLSHGKMNQ